MSSFPTCKVCRQQFSLKGPAPFLLPCLHNVCETCVTSADGGVLTCGPCEKDVNLTETPLQKDEVREKQILHLTVVQQPELVLCTYEEDGNQAVCWCNECDDFLCEHCQMVHSSSKRTKKHVVQNVGEMDPGKMNEDQYCSVHPKNIADAWDKDCCMLTCGSCRLRDHAGHEVVVVEESAEIARKEVSIFGNEIRFTIEQHKSHLVAAEKDLRSLDEKLNTLDGKILLTFTSLNTQVDQRGKELQIALQNHKVNMKDQLNDKKKTSETSYQRCLATSDFIDRTLKYSSPHSLLELKPMLEEIFQDCRRSAPTEDYKSLPLPVFNTDGRERIKSTLAQFGTITTDCSATTNMMQEHGTQTDEDMVQELEKLKQKIKQLETSQRQLMKEKEKENTGSWEEAEKFRLEVKQLKMSQDLLSKEKENMERDAEKLRKEVQQLQMSQDQLSKEKENMQRESEEAAEKFKQEVNLLKLSQDRQLKETEKTKGDSWKEAEKLRQEVNKLKMDQDQLIKENKKMEKESEEAAEKFKQEVNLLKLSQDRQLKETEKTKGDSWKEAEKLRQEVNKLKMDQDQLIKENKKMEKESEEAAEKFKQEVNLLKLSQDRQLKETEKTKGDSWKEAEKLRQEVNKLKMDQDQLIKENKKMEKESEEAAEKFKQEVNLLKLSQDRQLKETEKTKGDSWKEAEKLRQEVNKLKMDQDQLIKENKKMEKESEEAAEKFKQEVNLLKLSQDRQLKETEKTKGDSWKEAEKLRQEVNKLKMDQDQLIKENKKMEKESEEAAEKFKQEVNLLKLSQDRQLKETEKTKGDSWKEAEKLRQEVNKLKMDQDQLIKENKKMEKESEEAAEKFKQEVNLLKLSQDRQLKETEKTKGDSWKEAEKLRQEVNKLKMDQDQLIKENKKMEKESEEAAEKFKQEVNLLKLSQDRQLKETEKTKGDSWKEAVKLRQEVNKLKMDQDQLIKENKKMEKESKEAAEKLKQETKKLNVYQEKITGLEEIERRWHKLRTKALYEPFLLKCTKLKFSVTQYNTKTVHINTDSKLINRPQPNPPHSDQRLKRYDGTSSIVPLPQCGPPQYFEVESQVGIEKTLTRNTLLLEIGLAKEEEQDQSHSINARSNSYSLTVLYCTTHSSICRKVWRHGTSLTCLSDTLENTPGTSATLHYGVVYDSARSRIAFLDVKNEKIIGKIDNVDSSVALWPMFGVYNRRMVRVSMSLVVGDDINMTDKKKGLISECLS